MDLVVFYNHVRPVKATPPHQIFFKGGIYSDKRC
jgi:hypothetical protein